MTITVPAELAAAATVAGIDTEAVALTAIADAVEAAAIDDANEATNVARRAALDAVKAEIEPTRELVRNRPQPWVQPQGAHDAYGTGDRVMFEGATYESTIDANVWSPTGYPAGWRTA